MIKILFLITYILNISVKINESHYDCQKELGRGNFGTVNLCFKEFAIKENKNNNTEILGKSFIKNENKYSQELTKINLEKYELEILNYIKNKTNENKNFSNYFIKIYEIEENKNNKISTVMEKLDGDLTDYFKNYELLNDIILTEILFQGIQILIYLKNLNIIHKDIKEENMFFKLLKKNDEIIFQMKIGDFGLSQFDKYFSYVAGTKIYQTPELIFYNEINFINFKTDIWAFGIMFYNIIAKFYNLLQFNLIEFKTKDNKLLNNKIKYTHAENNFYYNQVMNFIDYYNINSKNLPPLYRIFFINVFKKKENERSDIGKIAFKIDEYLYDNNVKRAFKNNYQSGYYSFSINKYIIDQNKQIKKNSEINKYEELERSIEKIQKKNNKFLQKRKKSKKDLKNKSELNLENLEKRNKIKKAKKTRKLKNN